MIEVLRSRDQIEEARRELERRGLSFAPGLAGRALRKVARAVGVEQGQSADPWKSWDVLRTIDTLVERVPRDAAVLDAGCYCSQTLWSLHRLGYTALSGCDLDPRVVSGPFADTIRYSVQDLTRTSYADRSFAAIATISTIEHGVDVDAFLRESARLLAGGGLLLFSTDYAPERIDTTGLTAFGLPWRIWDEPSIRDLIERSREWGFAPLGELAFGPSELPIDWNGRRYTFVWGALRREGGR